jgi:ArsR family transcriptional regulator
VIVMPTPLYRSTAEFFRVLGHPVRIRVLELLSEGPKPVRDLLADAEIESVAVTASSLSQQLAVLRRRGMVSTTREGGSVVYALEGPDVTDLITTARRIIDETQPGGHRLFRQLGDIGVSAGVSAGSGAGSGDASEPGDARAAEQRRLLGARGN